MIPGACNWSGRKSLVSDSHGPHEVASLVIADAIPERAAFTTKIVDSIGLGLAFHQPEGHVPISSQVFSSSALLLGAVDQSIRFVSVASALHLVNQLFEVIAPRFEIAVLIKAGAGR